MAKVIEFYVRDLLPTKITSVGRDGSGEVIEFLKDKAVVAGKPRRFRNALKATQSLPLGRDVSS